MIQWMLAIWSLVPLPFLKPAWTSGSSQFTYCWSLAWFSSIQFSHSVVSDSLRPHGLQHARRPCPSPIPKGYSNSCPLSQWCHPTISSSVVHTNTNTRKTSISALLTMSKPLTVWLTINYGKFWKRWEYQTTWPASWETYMQVTKQQLKLGMEQQTSSKSGKEYVKAVIATLLI